MLQWNFLDFQAAAGSGPIEVETYAAAVGSGQVVEGEGQVLQFYPPAPDAFHFFLDADFAQGQFLLSSGRFNELRGLVGRTAFAKGEIPGQAGTQGKAGIAIKACKNELP